MALFGVDVIVGRVGPFDFSTVVAANGAGSISGTTALVVGDVDNGVGSSLSLWVSVGGGRERWRLL